MLTGNISLQPRLSTEPTLRLLLSLLLALSVQSISWAQPIIPAAPDLAARSWILIDANTGKVLTEHDSELQLPPASLTKMMTAYLTFEEVDSVGSLSMKRCWSVKMLGAKAELPVVGQLCFCRPMSPPQSKIYCVES